MAKKKLGSTKLTDELFTGSISLTDDVTGILPVPNGGTGIASGTSGGVPYFSSSTSIASSNVLANLAPVIGQGAGQPPKTIAGGAGTSGQVLVSNASASAEPTWTLVGAANIADAISNLFARIVWASPGGKVSNAIDTTGEAVNLASSTIASDATVVEIVVSDSATDAEPSATATLSAATTPIGTVLAGSGTATIIMRTSASTNAGKFAVKTTETATANRYLWVKQGTNSQTFVRANAAPQTLTF